MAPVPGCTCPIIEVPHRWQCDVVVLTQGGGRFDQAIANLNAFYAYVCLCVCVSVCDRGRHPDKRLRFVMEDSLVFLLCAGEHEIEVNARVAGPVCGLLPLAAACRTVTTSGLRWNLRASLSAIHFHCTMFTLSTEGQTMQMGGLISSSNEAVEPVVRVATSEPLLWSIELKHQQPPT